VTTLKCWASRDACRPRCGTSS